ncbi:MAG TPA: hypothetical protein VF579_00260 [Candidatus Methylomirabilis sp.]
MTPMTTTMPAERRGAPRHHEWEGEMNPVITKEKPPLPGAKRFAVPAAEEASWPIRAPRHVDDGQAARPAGRDAVVTARGVTKRYGDGDADGPRRRRRYSHPAGDAGRRRAAGREVSGA